MPAMVSRALPLTTRTLSRASTQSRTSSLSRATPSSCLEAVYAYTSLLESHAVSGPSRLVPGGHERHRRLRHADAAAGEWRSLPDGRRLRSAVKLSTRRIGRHDRL